MVQDIFIRAVFGKKRTASTFADGGSHSPTVSGDGKKMVSFIRFSSIDISYILPLGADMSHHSHTHLPEPVRIIHKEQESISAFCLNLQNPGLLALATPRECQEMDISLLLESPNWLEDECELDIMNLTKDIDKEPSSGFLMIQASDK